MTTGVIRFDGSAFPVYDASEIDSRENLTAVAVRRARTTYIALTEEGREDGSVFIDDDPLVAFVPADEVSLP